MGWKECQLCGGRIVDGRCTECGMYQAEDEGRYYLNQRRPESGRPELRQSEQKESESRKPERSQPEQKKPENKKPEGSQPEQKKPESKKPEIRKPEGSVRNQKKNSGFITILFLFICSMIVIPGINRMREKEQTGVSMEVIDMEEMEPEAAAPVDTSYPVVDPDGDAEPLPETGDSYEATLTAGIYQIGAQIPAGTYQVTAEGEDVDSMYFQVEKSDDGIYAAWWMADYKTAGGNSACIEQVNLYEGSELRIEDGEQLHFYTENALLDTRQEGTENPLTEQVEVTAEFLEAGVDFEPGVYDVKMDSGGGALVLRDADGVEERHYFYAEGIYASDGYRNLRLEEGDGVYMESFVPDTRIRLIPSEIIFEKK